MARPKYRSISVAGQIPTVTSSTPNLPPILAEAFEQPMTINMSPFKGKKKPPRRVSIKQPELRSQSEDISDQRKHYDIFDDHWLVESPRRIQFERTMLAPESPLSLQLDFFYEAVVDIPDRHIESAHQRVDNFIEYLLPRLKKLGNKIGIKITNIIGAGSFFDDVQVINARETDLFVVFKKERTQLQNISSGYKFVPLKRYVNKDGGTPDVFRYGRSADGTYLSSLTVAQNMFDLVDRALKLHSFAKIKDFCIEDGAAQIQVVLKDKYTMNLIPAAHLESDDSFLVTRPYTYDENPSSDAIWRVSQLIKEHKILSQMDRADRGMRRKAFKTLKALVKVEPTLEGITSYHIKTVLLHTFDTTVDSVPRWQKESFESLFLLLLRELSKSLSDKVLHNFFIREHNLFAKMHHRILGRLNAHVAYLLANQNELLRVLKKRSNQTL